MKHIKATVTTIALAGLAACGSGEDAATEPAAEPMATAPMDQPPAMDPMASNSAQVGALGMTEAQLLDADLVAADGMELGEIEQIRRDAAGAVTGLLVEVEDTNPDRYVLIPLDGLTTRAEGDDMDIQTKMSMQDLAALPEAAMN